jgi:acyl-[acyl-carrier-protein]-phospholipid O-acyltransferase/long-chain-fatty-acid--[acyl-carrier-protein] ligase
MVTGTLTVAGLQAAGAKAPQLFLLIAGLSLAIAVVIARSFARSFVSDLVSILFRIFYRLEVRGTENLKKAGPNAILVLNHVSYIDAALAYSLLDKEPVFAVDRRVAQKWWARPFVNLTRAMRIDPTSPMATRALINAVRGGDRAD